MDFNVEARKLQLENLEQFISSSKDKIQNVLNSLGWNAQDVMQDNHFITCSLDPSHKVPQKSIEKHVSKCGLRKEGYDLNENFLSEPNTGTSSVHIDDHKKIEVLSAAHKSIENFRSGWNGQDPDPKTADRLTSTFSTDERLALYDYAVTSTSGPVVLPEFDIFSTNIKVENKPLGLEEKLALERDLKRRKIKYKSVHTSHKNHIEVMREVIEGQMELYTDWLTASGKTDSYDKELDVTKQELERVRSTAVSRNSNNSNSSKYASKKRDDRCNEETNDSRSTSRRTSLDRVSDRSYGESSRQRRSVRSRSRDDRHKRKYDYDNIRKGKYDRHYRREHSPRDRYRRDRRISPERIRSDSRERRRNGYRDHRNRY